MIHWALLADDIFRLHFVDIKILANIILDIRLYFCTINGGEDDQFGLPHFGQIGRHKQRFF
jgi:hypothetical protein